MSDASCDRRLLDATKISTPWSGTSQQRRLRFPNVERRRQSQRAFERCIPWPVMVAAASAPSGAYGTSAHGEKSSIIAAPPAPWTGDVVSSPSSSKVVEVSTADEGAV